MTKATNEEIDKEFLDKVLATLNKKGQDYGNNNQVSPYAMQLAAAKILTKAERLANIIYNKHEPNFESLEDTILDLCGYAILANRGIQRGEWSE